MAQTVVVEVGKIDPKSQNASINEDIRKFNELMDYTYEMAKKLLPFMARRRIPLTAFNYRLFFDYFEGSKPELSREINEFLQSGGVFSPKLTERLYHAYYDDESQNAEAIKKVGERLGTASHLLEENLGKSLGTTDRYRQILTDTAQQISLGTLVEDSFKELLDSLIFETNTALSTQSNLAAHIEKTTQIIASLTTELRDQTRLANIDELTQLYNRRYMTQRLKEILSGDNGSLTLSCILFDLDRFKNINDTWGHSTGDKVLIVCAKIIQNHAGEEFLAVRYGGEEFMIICPGLDSTDATALAESVRQQVESTQVTLRGQTVPVTISCGVSQYRSGEPEGEFISRADKALYKAKGSGRNCVCIVEAEG
jgi:diguanylate cyclase